MAAGITLNFSAVSKKLQQLKDRMPKAIARSLNRAAVSARQAIVPEIVRDTGLKASKVREAITIRNASPERLVVHVVARGARLPLIDFRGKGPEPSKGQPGRGVTANTGHGQQAIHGAFIARMPANKNAESGHRGIYKRKGGGARMSRGAWSKNLPIRQLFGPSITHVFTKFTAIGIKRGEESLQKNLAHEVKYMFGL